MNIKKNDLILIGGVILVILVSLLAFNVKAEKIEVPVKLEGNPGINEITYAEYEEKIDSGEPFLVMIVNDGCSYCEMFIPVMTEVANEYSIPVYSLNLAILSSDEYNLLSNSNSYLKRNQWGTPTTLLLQGKTVIASLGGYTEKENLVSFMKENIVLEEETETSIEE